MQEMMHALLLLNNNCCIAMLHNRINSLRPSDASMRQKPDPKLVQIMACHFFGANRFMNQCLNIVNLTLGNKSQWKFNRNTYIFVRENAFENVVWKIAAILSRFRLGSWPNLDLCNYMFATTLIMFERMLAYRLIWIRVSFESGLTQLMWVWYTRVFSFLIAQIRAKMYCAL